MALTDKSSIVVPKGFYGKANVLQGFNPQTESLVDLDVTRNTTATRVNEAGLIENVAANVPRRDFLNGGCGELLVEPQRTNKLIQSEDFSITWSNTGTSITVNQTSSPDGNETADLLSNDGTNGFHTIRQVVSVTTGVEYSFSVFVKKKTIGSNNFYLNVGSAGGGGSVFIDLNNYSIVGGTGTVTPYANGWFRISVQTTATSTGNSAFDCGFSDGTTRSYTGDNTTEVYIWGAQLEEGNYPTSYIPSTASAVTRNQDVISATNIGSLLNDAEGGIYVSLSWFNGDEVTTIQLNDNTKGNRVSLGSNDTRYQLVSVVNGDFKVIETPVSPIIQNNNFNKIALRYANDYALFVNGTKIAVDTNEPTFINNTLSQLNFGNADGTNQFYGRIRELIVFDNAPTDTELQTLTTP